MSSRTSGNARAPDRDPDVQANNYDGRFQLRHAFRSASAHAMPPNRAISSVADCLLSLWLPRKLLLLECSLDCCRCSRIRKWRRSISRSAIILLQGGRLWLGSVDRGHSHRRDTLGRVFRDPHHASYATCSVMISIHVRKVGKDAPSRLGCGLHSFLCLAL